MTLARTSRSSVDGQIEAGSTSSGARFHPVLVLQRTAGNRAVNMLMRQSEHETPYQRDMRYAREHERASEGIALGWMGLSGVSHHRVSTVWASQSETAHIPRADARVRAGEVGRGEPGWDLGLQYTTLDDLIGQLRSQHVYTGSVGRLAINCHGSPGVLRLEPFTNMLDQVHLITGRRLQAIVDGLNELPATDGGGSDSEFAANRAYYAMLLARLRTIAQFLTPSATVLFPGCIAGSGRDGTDLLRVLASPEVLNHRVVGFTRILEASGQYSGEERGRSLPGVRVTDLTSPTELQGARPVDDSGPRARLGDWANEDSPTARIADPDGGVSSNNEALSPAQLGRGEFEPTEADTGWGANHYVPASARGRLPHARTRSPLRRGQRVRDPVTGQLRRI